MSTLHYYRCLDCLSVATISENERAGELVCGVCAGAIEYLGQVNNGRIIRLESYCPCDNRCTAAIGPHCDCACGGENHGAGLLTRVVIVGTVKTLPMISTEKARRIAQEYREALAAAAAESKRLSELTAHNFSAKREDLIRYSKIRRAVFKAKARRCHRTRMADLAIVRPAAESELSLFNTESVGA